MAIIRESTTATAAGVTIYKQVRMPMHFQVNEIFLLSTHQLTTLNLLNN
jgi:hypothetical protein